MQLLYDLFNNDPVKVITGCCAIISLILSVINLARSIYHELPNIKISIFQLSRPINGVQQIMIDIINMSKEPIIITSIEIIANETVYCATKKPRLYLTKTRRQNGTVQKEEFFTVPLPFKVNGRDYRSECIEMNLKSNQPISEGNIKIVVITDRKKFKQRLKNIKYAEKFAL